LALIVIAFQNLNLKNCGCLLSAKELKPSRACLHQTVSLIQLNQPSRERCHPGDKQLSLSSCIAAEPAFFFDRVGERYIANDGKSLKKNTKHLVLT